MKPEPDVWLLFSPVKGDATETIVQKATELGASKIVPLSTQRTVVKAIKTERLRNIMVEAAEQCERLTCPVLEEEEAKVVDIVGKWPEDRMLILCDETAVSSTRETVLNNMYTQSAADKKAGILIGPEGGWTSEELDLIRSVPNAVSLSLGPRILRAETAAIAALSIYQAFHGDWEPDK
mmetsp:Transcript_40897/g.63844  ORF Transcript_40897/g.63844 Transcript_40897/m.63844 type:complete len:179 (-) Transcript_40897:19-555(-)